MPKDKCGVIHAAIAIKAPGANFLPDCGIPILMDNTAKISTIALGVFLAASALPSFAQYEGDRNHDDRSTSRDDRDRHDAKNDMKHAGHETKNAAKDAGHGVKEGSKDAYHATKRGVKKGASKTGNTVKGAVRGGKEGAHESTDEPHR